MQKEDVDRTCCGEISVPASSDRRTKLDLLLDSAGLGLVFALSAIERNKQENQFMQQFVLWCDSLPCMAMACEQVELPDADVQGHDFLSAMPCVLPDALPSVTPKSQKPKKLLAESVEKSCLFPGASPPKHFDFTVDCDLLGAGLWS